MDIMELGAIGELVGGVAVIASLIYVGLQVRQSNRQAQATATREVNTQFDRYLETIMNNPKARELWLVATEGPDRAPLANPRDLDRDDLTVLCFIMYRAFQQFHSQYRARQAGALDDREWARIIPWLRMHLVTDSALDWWAWGRGGDWFDADFTEFIDNEVRLIQQAGDSKLIYARS